MELEQMKTQWEMLDCKLSESNRINAVIVKKMIEQRANKGVNKLITYELIGAILCLIAIPFMIFWVGYMRHSALIDVTMYSTILYLCIVCISQLVKLFLLSRIDLLRSISENISTLNRYILFLKREKVAGLTIFALFSLLLILIIIDFKHIEPWQWAAVITFFVLTPMLTIWQYKKVYNANINAIRQSLDEMKELKEE